MLAVFRHVVLLILSILRVFQYFILRGAVILAVFQGFVLRGTAGQSITRSVLLECRSISAFITLDTRGTPSILDVCTAGTARTRAYILLTLPVFAVFGPLVLLTLQVLRVFRPPVLEYSQYWKYEKEYRVNKSTRSICNVLFTHQHITKNPVRRHGDRLQ